MTTWIKLCGLTTPEHVQTAVDCNVQAVGFVLAPSVRCVAPAVASDLAERVPSSVSVVAVMLRPTQAELDAVFTEFMPDFVQADWQALVMAVLPKSVKALPVFRQGDGVTANQTPQRFVYEGALSGQGQTVDWRAARSFARERELILAGGLNPDNVGDAIRSARPFGVDVSSGIERQRGVKDPDLMRNFVAQVRAGESSTASETI